MRKSRNRMIINTLVVSLLIILAVSVYTAILQKNYSESTVDAAVAWDTQCADAIHKLVSNKFTREDFNRIVSVEDMDSERYQEL